jgi:carboxymethylenebutenolidase
VNDAIETLWITLPTTGGTLDAHLTVPPTGHGPGLLLLQEIFGVNAHIRAVAAQYALAGFVVMAPDLFWRHAPRIELGYGDADRQHGMTLARGLKPELTMMDLRASVEALRGLPQCQGQRVGALGYCIGGRMAYMTAALAEIDAAVAYYGGGIHDQLHLASGIGCPIQFHYAGADDHIPPEAVERVRQAFAGRGPGQADVHVYPGTAHGFNCWARGSWHLGAALQAQARTLAFLGRHLVG